MKQLIDKLNQLKEAVYGGNLGFAEMMKFYQVADKNQISIMEKLLKLGKAKDAWELLKQVTGVQLKDIGLKNKRAI